VARLAISGAAVGRHSSMSSIEVTKRLLGTSARQSVATTRARAATSCSAGELQANSKAACGRSSVSRSLRR
jgi:hypothetical protein